MLKKIAIPGAVAVALVGAAVAASAQESQGGPEATVTAANATTVELDDELESLDDELEMDDELLDAIALIGADLDPELIDELNAEADALVEHLRGLAHDVSMQTVEVRVPVFDEENDALWEAIDDFYAARFADEAAGWSDEEKAEWNADVDGFVEEMAELGITVETTEIAPGVRDAVWTDELDEALWELELAELEDEGFDIEDLDDLGDVDLGDLDDEWLEEMDGELAEDDA